MSVSDLHLCEDSVKSNSETSSCNCPPEYYCTKICGEAANTISTIISWQHFPRSTSHLSSCIDSSEEPVGKSLSDTTTPVETKEKEPSEKPSSTEYPITKSFAQLNAQHYLEVRHIYEFLNFLLSHLVCNEPEDPISFLMELLDKCLKFRDYQGEAPLLFTPAHVRALCIAFDPFERDYLTPEQYKEAMRSLGLENGITPYNKNPSLNEEGFIDINIFFFEAEKCLLENLKQMLRIPQVWEENRFMWKKRMDRKKSKAKKSILENQVKLDDDTDADEKSDEKECEEYPEVFKKFVSPCICDSNSKFEVEQLFLN